MLKGLYKKDTGITIDGYGIKYFVGTSANTSLSHTSELTQGAFDSNTFILSSWVANGTSDLTAEFVIKDAAAGTSYTNIGTNYQNDTRDASSLFAWYYNRGGSTETVFMGTANLNTAKPGCNGLVVGFGGVSQFTPFDVTPVVTGNINTGQPTPGAITPVTSGSRVALIGNAADNVVPTALASIDDAALRSAFTSIGGSLSVQSGIGLYRWMSGTYTPAAWTGGTTNTGSSWNSLTAALRPRKIAIVGWNRSNKAGATSGNTDMTLNSFASGPPQLGGNVLPGDLVVAFFSTGSAADRTLAISDGTTNYTLIGSELYSNGTSYDTNLRVAYKFMGSTPDTFVRFGPTGNANDAGSYGFIVFRGVDQVTPLDGVAPTTATGTATSNPTPAAITPSTSRAVIMSVGAGAAATTTVLAPGTDFHIQISSSSLLGVDTNDSVLSVGLFEWASGAFTPAAWTGGSANAADSWAALTFALRPR